METMIWLIIVIAVAIAVSAAALYHQRIIDARDVPRQEDLKKDQPDTPTTPRRRWTTSFWRR
jgi:hypothetical protein